MCQCVHNNIFSVCSKLDFIFQFNNMDNIDNGPTHTVLPHGNGSEHFKDILTPDNDTENENHRHCVSLPLYYDQVGFFLLILTPSHGHYFPWTLPASRIVSKENAHISLITSKSTMQQNYFERYGFFYHPFPTNSF